MKPRTHRRPTVDTTEPLTERPSIAAVWDRLVNLEKLVANDIIHRLDNIESKQDKIDGALGLLRWAIPVLVAVAAIVAARFI